MNVKIWNTTNEEKNKIIKKDDIKNKPKFSRIIIRKIITYLWVVLWYFTTIYMLFFKESILQSMIPLLIFFVFFHFAFLEFRKYKSRWIWILFVVISLIEILLLWFSTRQIPISVLIFNIWVVFLSIWLRSATSNKRKFKAWTYFTVAWYMFTILMTLSYTLFLIWGKHHMDLSCWQIQQSSDRFIDTLASPFVFGWKEITLIKDGTKDIKQKKNDFFNINVLEVLHLWKQVEVTPTDTIEDKKLFSWLIDKFDKLQTNIDTAIKENTKVNLGICDLILWKITQIYNHPTFQFTVVILMVLLLSPFIRFAFWIVSIIAFLIFKLLFLLKIYKTHKVLVEVDEIW